MRANALGSSGVAVSAIGLGTAQLGDLYRPMDQDAAARLVDTAWAEGIRYFDTAPHYGLGLAERRLGRKLAGRPRKEFVISSKVGRLIVEGASGPQRAWDFSADGVLRSLEASLARLGLTRIDVALIHDPQGRESDALEHAYPALDRLRAEGVVGAIGVGTGNLPALERFARDTDIDAVMVAGRLTLLDPGALDVLVPTCSARGISILNAGVFNSGILADPEPSSASHYEYDAPPKEVLARVAAIATILGDHGISLPEAAVRYAATATDVASVVVGADDPEQLRQIVRWLSSETPIASALAGLRGAGILPPRVAGAGAA